MNHKRRRPKARRGGCLMCKMHKRNHAKASYKLTPADRRRNDSVLDQALALGFDPELTRITRQYAPELFDSMLADALSTIPDEDE